MPISPTPPAFHDRGSRCLIDHTPSGWQVFGHPLNDERHRYFAPRGMLHLQWWRSEPEVSLITPCRLTEGRFELWTPTRHVRCCCYNQLVRLMTKEFPFPPPPRHAMRRYEWSFVRVFEIGAVSREHERRSMALPW
ncbi:MAG: hypothetical protein AAGA48_18825 [Myxococcota bacterium]